jgi:hypothetical protein
MRTKKVKDPAWTPRRARIQRPLRGIDVFRQEASSVLDELKIPLRQRFKITCVYWTLEVKSDHRLFTTWAHYANHHHRPRCYEHPPIPDANAPIWRQVIDIAGRVEKGKETGYFACACAVLKVRDVPANIVDAYWNQLTHYQRKEWVEYARGIGPIPRVPSDDPLWQSRPTTLPPQPADDPRSDESDAEGNASDEDPFTWKGAVYV